MEPANDRSVFAALEAFRLVVDDPTGSLDEALVEALGALASRPRLVLLRQLRTPRTLREIEVKLEEPG